MAMRAAACVLPLTVALGAAAAAAVEPPSASATPAAAGDERLVFSTNGSQLTGGSGAGGASGSFVGNLGNGAVIGAGAEYQQVSSAHWTAGDLSGSVAPGLRTHLYAEAHEGAGDIGTAHAFHYSLLLGGLLEQLTSRMSVQLEERRIDIDTSHGNLPKAGVSYQFTPRLLGSASYAVSAGGNLGTHLGTARLDYTGSGFNALVGIAAGPVAPAVVDLLGHVVAPSPKLHEGFLGIGMPLGRTDWLLIGDYQDVGGTKRVGLSLTCTVHLHPQGRSP